MLQTTPQTIRLADYTPPSFLIDTVHLDVDFQADCALVSARLMMRRNPLATADAALVLDGEELELLSVSLDGVALSPEAYQLTANQLTLNHLPDAFRLDTVTRIHPDGNTQLSGLYRSANGYFTQCEAQGFRRITWFMDRPDVMSRYTVTIHADQAALPQLLSNGNPLDSGMEAGGRHWARWQDPHPKPCYLFALVAAKLDVLQDHYRTLSGREVQLAIYVEPGKLDQCAHAMAALKKSMQWDEQTFGLECDLDHYMIVAVSDFNMGAMENKGLNIFNTKYVLANSRVATDVDYAGIESVVGHEYFHNWTGNRVTCRDWFQLSLKEGLTVFRDQEFSGDLVGNETGRAVKRIDDVRVLRQVQFSEDAGPMSHPVRPDSYVEINNFYTVTVYEKGAEVVRMYYSLLGHDGFRKGMDLYFQRHDGQAVTCDDFRAAMADANGRDLTQFERWYSQAGTPRIKAKTHYDVQAKTYTLSLKQTCPDTAAHTPTLPFHIPVAVGLLDAAGKDMSLNRSNLNGQALSTTTAMLELTKASQDFVFTDIAEEPVPSILRNFSAPVVLDYDYSDAQLAHLLAHDSDAFCRWEAGQRLVMRRLLKLIAAVQNAEALELDAILIAALRKTLNDTNLDPAFRELVMTLPSETMLAEAMPVADPLSIHRARQFARASIAQQLKADLLQAYQGNLTPGKYSPDAASAGKRALKNCALNYLVEWPDASTYTLAHTQYQEAANMTDRMAAMTAMLHCSSAMNKEHRAAREQVLAHFYSEFETEALVIDKWFSLQVSAPTCDVATVKKLMKHPAFKLSNPNRARSVIFAFCNANPARFHADDGSGYALWADCVIALNKLNPQVAARLARSLDRWKKYAPATQEKMRAALERVAASKNLSKDVLEVVTKALAA